MKDDNERVEALNTIFDDDPAKKAREKEIKKLEKNKEITEDDSKGAQDDLSLIHI